MQTTRRLVANAHRIQVGVNELKATLGLRRFRHSYVINPGNQRVLFGVEMRGLPIPGPRETAQLLIDTGVMKGSQSKTCDK